MPSLRADASGRSSVTGKPRSSSTRSIVPPTAPVAPTTATLNIGTGEVLAGLPTGGLARQVEGVVEGPHRPLDLAPVDDDRDADRARVDHLEVDALVGEHAEHLGRDAGLGLHARPDQRDLADLVVARQFAVAEVAAQP